MDQSPMGTEVVGHGKTCKCVHHKMTPILIVLFGLTFLLGNLGKLDMSIVHIIWPILVIIGGLQKAVSGMCKCCK